MKYYRVFVFKLLIIIFFILYVNIENFEILLFRILSLIDYLSIELLSVLDVFVNFMR